MIFFTGQLTDNLPRGSNYKMSERFNIGESGPLTWFLGISFKWGDGSLTMKHQGYVSNLLRKHGMGDCKAASTPLAEQLDLTKDQMPEDGSDEQQQMLRHDYRGLVGSIAYLSLSTRPDLAFPAHLLSRFLSNPGFAHWQAAKHVLRYLRGTADVGITFMKCDDTGPNGYTDSDYASCKNDRRSITGFCFNVGSGAISWAARRQTCVATSTTEAELHALSEAVKEATLFTESQSCLALATRDDNSAKTKHFATRMAYVRETVKNQSIDLKFIASGDNCADIFMKGLGKTKTQQHLARLSAMRWYQGLPSCSQGGNDQIMSHDP